jgi:hypothetical protein
VALETVTVQQWFRCWAHCLTTVTVIVDVTMETMLCSLLYLISVTDTVMLNNVRKERYLVLSLTSCYYTTFIGEVNLICKLLATKLCTPE